MKKTIMLVEDNSDDEALTLRAVRKHISHEIIVARDGVEALDFIFGPGPYEGRDSSGWPLIILLDLKLPKISGLEVLRQIKEDVRTCHVPVIVFSSATDELEILSSYSLGANSYIRKSVNYDHFCKDMEQILAYWLGVSQLPPPPPTDPLRLIPTAPRLSVAVPF